MHGKVFLIILTFNSWTIAKVIYTGKEKVSLINTIETKNSFVSYVLINGKLYLLKQKKMYKKQLAVVRDALAAEIAQTLCGFAQEIDIIGASEKIFGKIKIGWPATLHTIAPGETVRKQPKCKYSALRLRQCVPLAMDEEMGLTKTIIEYMTWHRQIPEIIALDLLTGNGDRNCGNFCYDSITDTFFLIDMDDTFDKDLCDLAYRNLKFMLTKEKVIFSKEEIRALAHMRDTLKFLIRKNTPYDLIQKLYFFAKKAGFSKGSSLYTDRIQKKLLLYETMIIQSYVSAHKLITLLDSIITYKFPKR
jgi:hypothetical protein